MAQNACASERTQRRHFLAAAERRHFRFSEDTYTAGPGRGQPPQRSHRVFRQAAVAASLIVCALGAVWSWWVLARVQARPVSAPAIVAVQPAVPRAAERTPDPAPLDQARALAFTRDRLRRAERASAARAAASESARVDLEQKLAALQRELADAGAERADIQARLDTAQHALDAAGRELSEARRQNASDAMLLELKDSRMAALAAQVRESDDQLARQKQLLAVNRDIRDLMGARNLHVIDVFDVDGRGKTRRAFGRAFYTEGKSLIFYAFDLASAASRAASFQAWGQREAGGASVLSLGLLYSDDQTQNRWTLKFEDAKVLEQIDAVFVTVEPPGGSRSPQGRRLLYAYLRQKANHP